MSIPSVSTDPLGYTEFDSGVQPSFIVAQRDPTTNDVKPYGTQWENTSASPKDIFQTTGNGVWINITNGGGGSGIVTINGDSGSITGSVVTIKGATAAITFAGSGSTLLASLTGNVPGLFYGNSGSTVAVSNGLHLTGSGSVFTSATPGSGIVTFQGLGTTDFHASSGTATAASNAISIVGTGGITTTGSGSTITIAGSGGGGTTWNFTSTSATLVKSNAYYVSGTGITLTMPNDGSSNFGDTITVFVSPNSAAVVTLDASPSVQQFFGASLPATGKATLSLSKGSSIQVVYEATAESKSGWAILYQTGTVSYT